MIPLRACHTRTIMHLEVKPTYNPLGYERRFLRSVWLHINLCCHDEGEALPKLAVDPLFSRNIEGTVCILLNLKAFTVRTVRIMKELVTVAV